MKASANTHNQRLVPLPNHNRLQRRLGIAAVVVSSPWLMAPVAQGCEATGQGSQLGNGGKSASVAAKPAAKPTPPQRTHFTFGEVTCDYSAELMGIPAGSTLSGLVKDGTKLDYNDHGKFATIALKDAVNNVAAFNGIADKNNITAGDQVRLPESCFQKDLDK